MIVLLCLRGKCSSFSSFKVAFIVQVDKEKCVKIVVEVRCLFTVNISRASNFAVSNACVVLRNVFFICVRVSRDSPPTATNVVTVRLTVIFITGLPVVRVACRVNRVFVIPIHIFVMGSRNSYEIICGISTFYCVFERHSFLSENQGGFLMDVIYSECGRIFNLRASVFITRCRSWFFS